MQAWYLNKRKELEKVFAQAKPIVEDIESFSSPSSRYSLEVVPYSTGPSSWSYSKGIVRLASTGEVITEVNRNIGVFPFSWAEHHPSGHDYLVSGEDYEGQTIIELDTGRRIDFIPESAESGWGFCWAKHYPSPDGRFIFVDGCYWGAPYELVLYEFSDPMALPYKEVNRWPVREVAGFQDDGAFTWKYDVEIRTSDGKRVDKMSEEEAEEFEESEEYSKLLGEETIHVRWLPNGDVEEVEK